MAMAVLGAAHPFAGTVLNRLESAGLALLQDLAGALISTLLAIVGVTAGEGDGERGSQQSPKAKRTHHCPDL